MGIRVQQFENIEDLLSAIEEARKNSQRNEDSSDKSPCMRAYCGAFSEAFKDERSAYVDIESLRTSAHALHVLLAASDSHSTYRDEVGELIAQHLGTMLASVLNREGLVVGIHISAKVDTHPDRCDRH